MKKSIIYLTLILLFVTGCNTMRHVEPELQKIEPMPMNGKYTVIKYQGYVKTSFFAKKKVYGELRMAEDSAMWMNILANGVEIGLAMCTQDSLWAKSPHNTLIWLGIDYAYDYNTLEKEFGIKTSFEELQSIPFSDDYAEKISILAKSFDFEADVKITSKYKVETLSFPYAKPR